MLVWATLAGLLIGVLGLGQPLDDWGRMLRSKLRLHPPSGEIVVVAIDDRSIEEMGAWPWPRTRHAALVDRLHALKAKHIYFDIFFTSRTTPADERALEAAMRRAGNTCRSRSPTRAARLRANVSPESRWRVSATPPH